MSWLSLTTEQFSAIAAEEWHSDPPSFRIRRDRTDQEACADDLGAADAPAEIPETVAEFVQNVRGTYAASATRLSARICSSHYRVIIEFALVGRRAVGYLRAEGLVPHADGSSRSKVTETPWMWAAGSRLWFMTSDASALPAELDELAHACGNDWVLTVFAETIGAGFAGPWAFLAQSGVVTVACDSPNPEPVDAEPVEAGPPGPAPASPRRPVFKELGEGGISGFLRQLIIDLVGHSAWER